MQRAFLMVGLLVAGLAACGPGMPGKAVQPSNRMEQGVVIGVRRVAASSPAMAVVSGVTGSLAERVAVDTVLFEYIVRKANDDLVSVTQADRTPLTLRQNVRVIAGNRARVTPDYAASADSIVVRPKMRLADAPVEEMLSAPAVALQP